MGQKELNFIVQEEQEFLTTLLHGAQRRCREIQSEIEALEILIEKELLAKSSENYKTIPLIGFPSTTTKVAGLLATLTEYNARRQLLAGIQKVLKP